MKRSTDASYVDLLRFYASEAALLDRRDLVAWLDVFTEEVTYRLYTWERRQVKRAGPGSSENVPVLLLSDDREFLHKRVRRLVETDLAHAERPMSLTRHLITNLRVHEEGDSLSAETDFVVFQSRLQEDRHQFYGSRRDLLVVEDDRIRVSQREVFLDQFILDRTVSVLF